MPTARAVNMKHEPEKKGTSLMMWLWVVLLAAVFLFFSKAKRNVVGITLMGGLGNQMFQIACALSYSKRESSDLVIGGDSKYWDTVLHRFHRNVGNVSHIREQCHEPSAAMFGRVPPFDGDVKIEGYRQSPKYFEGALSDVRDAFRSDPSFVRTKYAWLLEKDNVVTVHARRGDYLTLDDVVLKMDYYVRAIRRMKDLVPDATFVFFSDDDTFWPSVMDQFDVDHVYVQDETDVNTMMIIQQFRNHIISNSTFSWWSAWLSDTKGHVIAPARWFGPSGPTPWEDIYDPGWEIM